MNNTTISRRDFLKGSAWAATLFALPVWANTLDEEMPASYMSFGTTAYPLEWSAPAALANVDPIVVALNRVTFGPRPGDFERVQSMGVDNFIEEQLSPTRIDDAATDALLKQFPSLSMSITQLVENYAQARTLRKMQKGQKAQGAVGMQPNEGVVTDAESAVRGFLGLFGINPNAPGNTLMSPGSMTTPMEGPVQIVSELTEATVLRQTFSERQLYELMVDFWSNHFNIYVLKNTCKVLKTADDRDVIRAHALGKFSDLLHASAHSPAMLVYLDNVTNNKGVPNENYSRELMELHTLGVNGGYTQSDVLEVARCFTGWSVNTPRKSALGMEYDHAGEFLYHANQHDDGAKQVLGVKIAAGGGTKDGEQVLDLLARHPKTAEFISRKLVQRFVSDNPPDALVARTADTFLKSDGDIRAVLSTVLHSDEFKQSFGQKAKRPLEYVASAVRALHPRESANVLGGSSLYQNAKKPGGGKRNSSAPQPIALALRVMGQVPFMWQSPNGYPDVASAWINSNNLLARWNLALALVSNQASGMTIDLDAMMKNANVGSSPAAVVDFWTQNILHRAIPDADRAQLASYLSGDTSKDRTANLVALILSSPHFQYR